MKPCPIPDLEGKAAKDFARKISKDSNELQKRMVKDGIEVFGQTKKHENTNLSNKQNKR